MSSEEDFIYIEKIQQGDFEALSYIVDKYKDMVYNIALKIVKNRTEAEDIAQESFIKVYQQIHTFKKESKFSPGCILLPIGPLYMIFEKTKSVHKHSLIRIMRN